MSVVTSLRATRGGRIAVHLDGSYACTVSSSLLAAFRLYQGRELSDEETLRLHAQAQAERVVKHRHPRARHAREQPRQRRTHSGREQLRADQPVARRRGGAGPRDLL